MPDGEEGIANFVQRGEIRVGGLRMCLFEIIGGFYSIRTSLERSIGPAAATILYQAGVEGGKRFASSASKIGMIRREAAGLNDCIDVFSQAGFGNFQVVESDWRDCRVIIECYSPTAFEAFAFMENKTKRSDSVCDYSRGVIAGFCQQLSGKTDVLCVELECRATGAHRCVFETGHHSRLLEKAMSSGVKL